MTSGSKTIPCILNRENVLVRVFTSKKHQSRKKSAEEVSPGTKLEWEGNELLYLKTFLP